MTGPLVSIQNYPLTRRQGATSIKTGTPNRLRMMSSNASRERGCMQMELDPTIRAPRTLSSI